MVVKTKKQKAQKMCVIKRELKFKDYRNRLKANQLENKINQQEKTRLNTESFKENHNEFIKNNKLILKTQQRFKSERHNVFTDKINKIALSSNDDERIRSIDLVETYAHETSIDLISKKQKIKCNNTIKLCKQ